MKHLLNDPSLWRDAAFIDGKWLAETAHGHCAVHNPADGTPLPMSL
jgi:succinate-semialdehyde dehydrogenase/glutarate-semialdehyde dehydrogenase